jgi:hypothetical protein
MKKFNLVILVLILVACTTIKYQDDTGYLNSAQAESPEFPVYLNGKVCKDTDNQPGLCSKKIQSNSILSIEIPALPYSYKLDLACTKSLDESKIYDVEANTKFIRLIPPEKFASVKSFICIGEIFPKDRPEQISALWEVRVKISDKAYTPRESIYLTKKHGFVFLVMGEYARSILVYDQGQWRHYSKTAVVRIKGDPSKVRAYSESYQMRFNFFQFDEKAPEQTPFYLHMEKDPAANQSEVDAE